jgi:transposase InsO family protein
LLLAIVSGLLLAAACILLWLRQRRPTGRPHRRSNRGVPAPSRTAFTPPKPPWVRREILRLKALLPDHGCRKIAQVFNHLHRRRGETVGKTFVASVLKGKEHEILRLRRRLKHRRPRRVPRNLLWALDLTFLPDPQGPRTILGLLEHGSRACLALRELRSRSAISVLRALLDALERFGQPRILRTDNEPIFTSRLFRWALLFLGIRHQRTAPFAPWQNGRLERLFATFKSRILPWLEENGIPDQLDPDLALFRAWYNHARPHQHLDGLTPALAWAGKAPAGRPRYLSEWNGLLTGFLWPS